MAASGAAAPVSEGIAMRHALFWLIGLTAVAALAAFVVVPDRQPVTVSVAVLQPGPTTRILAVNGLVVARQSVAVRAPVTAQAVSVHVEEGMLVAAGDRLAQLDDAVARALAEQAAAARDTAQVRLAQARSDLDRARALGANVSARVVQDAEFAVSVAEAEFHRQLAAFEQAETTLATYTLRAPIDGTVLTRAIEPGERADAQAVLFDVADMSELLVEAEIDEIYAAEVVEGQRALLRPAGMSRNMPARVVFAAPRIDPATGGRVVRLAFDDQAALPVGLSVTVNLVVEERDAALTVPRAALLGGEGRRAVLLLRDGQALRVEVEVIEWPAERLIVTAGLAAGDAVILDPAAVPDGRLLRVAGD
jgi:RND family efflux transporter MFP subunit